MSSRLVRALRHRNYRLFFGGQSVSLIGTWITRVATSWLVYRLTGSELLLGVVGFAGQIPLLILAPFAGVLADRWDRQRLLVVTQILSALQSLALAVLATLAFGPDVAGLGIIGDLSWVGLNGVVKVTDKLSLTADAAYLPYVAFQGSDNHVLRNGISPEAGTGQGVQLEGIIGYSLGKYFSIGAGGRYWAMWATNTNTNFFGTPCPCQTLPVRTERFGVFLQASAKLDGLH